MQFRTFKVVYEAFHHTLARELPHSTILAHAINSLDKKEMPRIPDCVYQMSKVLGLRTNTKKTRLYRWSHPPRSAALRSGRDTFTI